MAHPTKELVALLAATLAGMSHVRVGECHAPLSTGLSLQYIDCSPLAVCLQGLHANLSTSTALQIGARPFDEATLFEIGYAYEQLVSHVL